MENVHAHEQAITAYALERLATVPGVTVLGPADAAKRGGAIAFELEGCTRTTSARSSTPAASPSAPVTTAPSRPTAVRRTTPPTGCLSYLYTTPAEIDALVEGLEYVRTFFKLDK